MCLPNFYKELNSETHTKCTICLFYSVNPENKEILWLTHPDQTLGYINIDKCYPSKWLSTMSANIIYLLLTI